LTLEGDASTSITPHASLPSGGKDPRELPAQVDGVARTIQQV
jgi:hypothetical protein